MRIDTAAGLALLVLLALSAGSVGARVEGAAWAALPEAAAQQQAMPQDETVTVSCKPPGPREQVPHLKLDGKAQLPEHSVLKVGAFLLCESFTGNSLMAMPRDQSPTLAEVRGKKFHEDYQVEGSGLYRVVVELLDELQQKVQVLKEIQGKQKVRKWEFTFPAWGDELTMRLGNRLLEIDALVQEGIDLCKKFEKASETQVTWAADSKRLLKEAETAYHKLDGPKLADTKALYPAAHELVTLVMCDIVQHSPYLVFVDGKFSHAKNYHENDNKARTFRKEDFSYKNLQKYFEEVPAVAGREFALWIIKDLRRTQGTLRSGLADTIKAYAQHPGLAPFADRLPKLTVEDLDPVEREIRKDTSKPKEDPPKGAKDK